MLLKYYQKLDDAISYLFSSVSNEKKLLKNIFDNKKIFYVDIGTNEGNYVGFLSNILNIKKIVTFEPIKKLNDKISERYSNLKIDNFNYALSNKKGTRMFYQYNISSQSSFYEQNNLFKSLKKLKKKFKIKTIKFDDFFNKNQVIDFCKIDVQGEEMNVLKGMKKNLNNKKIKLIKVELSFIERYQDVKPNFYDIIGFLNKYKYKLISISKIKYKNEKILLMDAFFSLKKWVLTQ